MRSLEINKRTIYYAEKTAEQENDLGERIPTYSQAVPALVHVQDLRNTVRIASTDKVLDYEVKLIASKAMPFTENTVFWIDRATSEPHDFVMKELPLCPLNDFVYRLKAVDVAHV